MSLTEDLGFRVQKRQIPNPELGLRVLGIGPINTKRTICLRC